MIYSQYFFCIFTYFLFALAAVSARCIYWENSTEAECIISSFDEWNQQFNRSILLNDSIFDIVSESNNLVFTNQDLELIFIRIADIYYLKPEFDLLGFFGFDHELFSTNYIGSYIIDFNFDFSRFQVMRRTDNQKWEIFEKCDLRDLVADEYRPKTQLRVNLRFQRYNIYNENTCPILFLNLTIHELKYNDLTQSFLKVNMLGFKYLTAGKNVLELNFDLEQLHFHNVYMARLSTNLFHPQVFSSYIYSIQIRGHIGQVEPGFLRFVKIGQLLFRVHNLRKFVQLNPQWLQGYSSNRISIIFIQQKKFESKKLESGLPAAFDFNPIYYYPDEDFCLFRNYPVEEENVLFLLQNDFSVNLTCTAFWLKKKWKDFYNLNQERDRISKWIANNITLFEILQNSEEFSKFNNHCYFSQRLALCDLPEANHTKIEYYFNIYNIIISIQMVKFIISIALKPIISLAGVIFGILTYLVLKDMKMQAKKFSDQLLAKKKGNLFEYMQVNALFGVIYNLSLLPRLLGDCIEFGGIYCSPWFANNSVRLFMLINAQYFAASIRMCANLSFLAFTVFRFSMNQVSKGFEAFSNFFMKQRPKRVMALSVLLAFGLNVCCLFYNDQETVDTLADEPRYDFFIFDLRIEFFEEDPAPVFIYIFLLILNDLLLPLLCFLLDFRLLLFIKAHLKQSSLSNTKNKKEGSEKKLTKFIVFNGLVDLILRTPHTLISMYRTYDQFYYNGHRKEQSICIFPRAILSSTCLNIYTATETLLGLRTTLEFFLFVLFNSEFVESLKKRFSGKYLNR
nr:G protein-coupled receptor [Proales similis]